MAVEEVEASQVGTLGTEVGMAEEAARWAAQVEVEALAVRTVAAA